MAGQRVIVYDVAPGGRVEPYATAYDDCDERVLWFECLMEKGEQTNPRVIDRPALPIAPGTPGRTPQKRF